MRPTLGSVPNEKSRDTDETVSSREGSPPEEEGGWVKDQLLYHVSLADRGYLVFVHAHIIGKLLLLLRQSQAISDCLTATTTGKETVYWPWARLASFGFLCPPHQDMNCRILEGNLQGLKRSLLQINIFNNKAIIRLRKYVS